jgi:hypothetical protein
MIIVKHQNHDLEKLRNYRHTEIPSRLNATAIAVFIKPERGESKEYENI